MVDCIIVGFNDVPFHKQEEMARSAGVSSPAYRDLRLAFVNIDGRPQRALEVLNSVNNIPPERALHNSDFLWPVISYLTSYLERRGHSVDYINLFQRDRARFADLLAEQPRCVAVTTTLYVMPDPIEEIIAFVRELSPGTLIVVGGPFIANQHACLDYEELNGLFRMLGADAYVISSEGEAALAEIVSAVKCGRSGQAIPNVVWRGDGYAIHGLVAESASMAAEWTDYARFGPHAIGASVSLRTAKSCPFACSFCGFPQRAGAYTYLDVKDVEIQLQNIRDHSDAIALTFLDDTFNVPRARFKQLLRMMRGYGFKWNCFYRCDHSDDEAIDLMREAGCEGVFLGVESGSDDMLRRMNKGARRADYVRTICKLRSVGISTYASLIVGFPGETEESVSATRDLLEETRPDFFRAQLWYCDPVTPIWRSRATYGVVGSGFGWSHDTMSSLDACDCIDGLFSDIKGSVWLPQHGFEQWSTFYLQRRGMERDAVTSFVKAFDRAVGDGLGRARPTEAAIVELRHAAVAPGLAKFTSATDLGSSAPRSPC
jgi:radical SAM PhpK family P-methyltransferase